MRTKINLRVGPPLESTWSIRPRQMGCYKSYSLDLSDLSDEEKAALLNAQSLQALPDSVALQVNECLDDARKQFSAKELLWEIKEAVMVSRF